MMKLSSTELSSIRVNEFLHMLNIGRGCLEITITNVPTMIALSEMGDPGEVKQVNFTRFKKGYKHGLAPVVRREKIMQVVYGNGKEHVCYLVPHA